MKKVFFIFTLFVFMTIPAISFAVPVIDVEAALGGWMQAPSGDLSYISDFKLDLEDDLDYDTITSITARAKVKLPVLPGLYVVAAPMEFDGDASDFLDDFTFGDIDFTSGESIYSKITLNQYDFGLYYGLPLLNLATMGKLNIDLGLNARYIDFEAEITGTSTTYGTRTEKKDIQLPIPMLYAGASLEPIERFAIEAELRGITYSDNTLLSFIGRLKVKILGPAYGAAGFRYDSIEVDEDDVKIKTSFSGPFLEVGFSL